MNQIRILKVICLILLFALVACQTQAISTTPTSTPNPLGEHVIAEWRVYLPVDIAFGFDSVWITGHRNPNSTIRIDPKSNKQIAVIENTGKRAHSVLVAGEFVWVDGEFDDMAKIDPQTNAIVARVPGGHTSLAYGFDSIWSTTRKDELDRIDPISAKIIASIILGDGYVDCNNVVVAFASAIWVGHCDEGELIKIDPNTNSIVSKTLIAQFIDQTKLQTKTPEGKATDFIWFPMIDPNNPQGCGLLQIDPNSGSGLTFRSVGAGCNFPTVTSDAIWLSGNNQIDRFDPKTNQIVETYKLRQGGISRLEAGFGSLWVIYESVGLVQRLDISP